MRRLLQALADLWLGLFGFPDHALDAARAPAAALEERYSKPRRCC